MSTLTKKEIKVLAKEAKTQTTKKRVGLWGDNHYVFYKTYKRGRFSINAEMRGSKCMGRFGGGWNWKIGAQWSRTTVILSLLVMSIRVSWYKPPEETEAGAEVTK